MTRDNFNRYVALYDKYIEYQNTLFRDVSCNSPDTTPAPPIFCCNNIINCDFGECINIVQTCKQTVNGETKISNATGCLVETCPINEQKMCCRYTWSG